MGLDRIMAEHGQRAIHRYSPGKGGRQEGMAHQEPRAIIRVMGSGAVTLRGYPGDSVRIVCEPCSRAGRYSLASLIHRNGSNIGLPDLLADHRGLPEAPGLAAPWTMPGGVSRPGRQGALMVDDRANLAGGQSPLRW